MKIEAHQFGEQGYVATLQPEKDEDSIDGLGFITVHASAYGSEVKLFLTLKTAEDLRVALDNALYGQGREIHDN